jgi:hypothetical protein
MNTPPILKVNPLDVKLSTPAQVVQYMTIKGLSDHLPVEAIFRLPPNASY